MTDNRKITMRKWYWAGVVALLLPIPLVYLCGAVDNIPYRHFGDCLFRKWLGYPCAGCGMTHAFFAFFHGHFRAAFNANPLFIMLAAGWGLLATHFILLALGRCSKVWLWLGYVLLPLLAAGAIGLWVVRIFFGWFPVA